MPEMIIDYLTFSLKPDQQAHNKRDVDLAFITDFLKLGVEWLNFENKGGRNGYPACYEYNDVLVHVPAPEHYDRMGYCVMMKGNGLRWYASLFKEFNIAVFLRDLVALTDTGLSLNVSRIDVAMDDKCGALDLDIIIEKALNHEYVSQSREKQVVREHINFKGDDMSGRTIYFGSRNSNTYIRIYDKAAEQGVTGHWIRVEYEFKQEAAIRIVNALVLTGEGFPAYFAQVSNHYLRFIELDDINRSRCSMSPFWGDFLGTVERASLAINEYKKKTLTKLFSYMIHSYAPSLYVLMEVFPIEFLADIFRRNGESRLRRKHYDMIKFPDLDYRTYANSEKWALEIPSSVIGQLAIE